jgi:hypothetical protein
MTAIPATLAITITFGGIQLYTKHNQRRKKGFSEQEEERNNKKKKKFKQTNKWKANKYRKKSIKVSPALSSKNDRKVESPPTR